MTWEVAKEQLLQCVWYSGLSRAQGASVLKTCSGKSLKVVFPGWWAPSSGPDFQRAKVVLDDGGVLVGDVEIHVRSSDWFRHGHERDPEYSNVILHVVFQNDAGVETIHTCTGRHVEQVEIGQQMKARINEMSESLDVDDLPMPQRAVVGPCAFLAGQAAGMEKIGEVLDNVGRRRFFSKASRQRQKLKKSDGNQVLFEGMMEACGYSANKTPFLILSRRLPISLLTRIVREGEQPLAIESTLIGASGFLAEFALRRSEVDDESRQYLVALEKEWGRTSKRHRIQTLDRSVWTLKNIRPKNYPPKRLAAVGWLLRKTPGRGLREVVLEKVNSVKEGRELAQKFLELFDCQGDSYWSYRDTFGGYKARRPQSLIGKERAVAMLSNVVLPNIVAMAAGSKGIARGGKVLELLASLPAHEDSVTRFMKHRIFGGVSRAARVVNNALRQQGLHALYERCYAKNGDTCEGCEMWNAMSRRN